MRFLSNNETINLITGCSDLPGAVVSLWPGFSPENYAHPNQNTPADSDGAADLNRPGDGTARAGQYVTCDSTDAGSG
jgi:hypothetical protein